jgi:hypothetical protein
MGVGEDAEAGRVTQSTDMCVGVYIATIVEEGTKRTC